MDMDFDYKLVTSYDFGRRLRNGTWTGLVGLLAGGKIDIIVGALTVTSKREEVIDFITPYFLHTGIGIVIRRPSHGKSLFKFMTVFRGEVWLSILSAITATTLMIWLLDKYSPYSSRNITNKYHKRCRKFSLKESFWFAVTSFTPQGGGELPNCLSARILVGAYWIFVVLVLATFTANLAAFLTVEQIESPVKSLEQLSKQSRIKYTVVKNSIAHTYIKNMKIAEEMLYKMWEKIAINYSCHGLEVWDYPVKEQFGGMLAAIEKTKFVPSFKEGIQKVLMNEDAGFSLIHDAVEIKYHIQKYCKLTTIGEPFAKRPYAIAVQQGSRWTQELARRLLELQKIRFFESLHLKYWNITKSKCNSLQENEGISLQSLGGVFIATLSGLLLSVISLCVEVIFKKRNKINMKTFKPPFKQNVYPDLITDKEFGLGFIKKTVLEEFIFQ
ncbi:hypothetical protein AAG570_006335 [Ranatra chinensis]|uniref:Ionotropic glutamate receptor C-terminal domain-containing protein n=1 Tax=Ranatra chinensis TaxID=642074 RepID=A0ABD0YTR4_9HEMI